MAGNARGLFAELWRDVEQARDASSQRKSRVGDAACCGRRDLLAPWPVAASGAVLLEYQDLRPIALIHRPIKRRLTFRRVRTFGSAP